MNGDVLWLDIISIARCSKNRAIVSEECAPSSQPTSNSLRPVELHLYIPTCDMVKDEPRGLRGKSYLSYELSSMSLALKHRRRESKGSAMPHSRYRSTMMQNVSLFYFLIFPLNLEIYFVCSLRSWLEFHSQQGQHAFNTPYMD